MLPGRHRATWAREPVSWRRTPPMPDLPDVARRPLPSGTVTFLFTDIEGSTRLWEQYPHDMGRALARHDALLRAAVQAHGGVVFNTAGDAFHTVFADAGAA